MTEVESFKALWDIVGIWSLPVIAVIGSIRLYRLPSVQDAIRPKWRWKAIPRWGQMLTIFSLSFATSLATSLIAGLGWAAAATASIPVALAAMLGHEGTRAVGHTMQAIAQGGDPHYQPSDFRKAASIVLPLNTDRLMRPIKGEESAPLQQ